MIDLLHVLRAYWQVTFIAFVLFMVLEFIKPGFVQSNINLVILFISALAAWVLDVAFSKKKN